MRVRGRRVRGCALLGLGSCMCGTRWRTYEYYLIFNNYSKYKNIKYMQSAHLLNSMAWGCGHPNESARRVRAVSPSTAPPRVCVGVTTHTCNVLRRVLCSI
jgi:hypothetical protein